MTAACCEPEVLTAQARRMLARSARHRAGQGIRRAVAEVQRLRRTQHRGQNAVPAVHPGAARRHASARWWSSSPISFRDDRNVSDIVIGGDYTFLNERLAKHYGVPGVTGGEFREVQSVRSSSAAGCSAWGPS
jgi:hypothetical protein